MAKKKERSKLLEIITKNEEENEVSEEVLIAKPTIRGRISEIFTRLVGGGKVIRKISRSKVPAFVTTQDPEIREPPDKLSVIWSAYNNNWICGSIRRAIKQEVFRNGVEVVPRFKKRCRKCKKEYREEVKECDFCKGRRFDTPDMKQHEIIKRLTTNPSKDTNFIQALKSILDQELALGNWYISVGYSQMGRGDRILRKPTEFYVEDAIYFLPVADAFGKLGGYEFFCRKCWDEWILNIHREYEYEKIPWGEASEFVVDIRGVKNTENLVCPKCGGELTQTAYVQLVNGAIQARFGEEEVVHGGMNLVYPQLFATSRLATLWKPLQCIQNMDDYNWETYMEGKTGSMVIMPGYDEVEVKQIKQRVDQAIGSVGSRDVQTGTERRRKKINTIWLGGKRNYDAPSRISLMEDLQKMQSIEFYKQYITAICSEFGVQPIFVALPGEGRGSTPIIDIRVGDRTTKDYQEGITNIFNDKVWKIFNVTDWIIEFPQIEERDELRDANVKQVKAATLFTLSRAGIKAKTDAEGEVVISDLKTKPEMVQTGMGSWGRQGEPRRAEQGSATGVASVRPDAETRESTQTGELVQRMEVALLPTSWGELTRFEAFGRMYELNNDMNEIYLTINSVEVPETRQDARNFHYGIAMLVNQILSDSIPYVIQRYGIEVGGRLRSYYENWVYRLRREYSGEVLKEIANYFEGVSMPELAKKFDNLRDRLDKIQHSPLEEQHVE